MPFNLSIVLIVSIALGACQGSEPRVHSTTESTPRVSIEPPDLTSDLGLSQIRLILEISGREVTTDEVAAMQSALRLTDASGQDIPFTTDTTSEAPGDYGPKTYRAYINIYPTAPLPDGWNNVQLSQLPTNWQPVLFSWQKASDGQPLTARLGGQDTPVIRTLHVCWSDSKLVATLETSQNVILHAKELTSNIEILANNATCQLGVPDDAVDDFSARAFDFACIGNDMPEDLEINTNSTTTQAGAALGFWGAPDSRSIRLSADQFENDQSQGDDCRMYRF